MVKCDAESKPGSAFREDSLLLIKGLDSVSSSLSQLTDALGAAQQSDRSLNEDLKFITQQLEDLRERKNDRSSQFLELREHILYVSTQIDPEHGLEIVVDEYDLSIRKLEDLHRRLYILREEKIVCPLLPEHPLSSIRPLRELLGHTPLQVIAGAILGFVASDLLRNS